MSKKVNFRSANISKFIQSEQGATSVEFAILLPGFFLVGLSLGALCIYLATLSDVQQLANEMTRLSLSYLDRAYPVPEVCTLLQTDVMPHLAEGLVFMDQTRVTGVTCGSDDTLRTISVAVSYDMQGTLAHRLAVLVGLDLPHLGGSAEMVL